MRIEQEEIHFKIFDDNNYLLAYFQPVYDDMNVENEKIMEMIERKEKIKQGLLYLPMLKLNLIGEEYKIEEIKQLLEIALTKVERWIECLKTIKEVIDVRVIQSHTDPDMLALLLDLIFDKPVSVNSKEMDEVLFLVLRRFIDNQLL